ncbi:MAG: carbonic anhydrase [Magnetococcus sp. DMHC-1]|nr:carbonic anhydrase [Magnetococcales bacterium]
MPTRLLDGYQRFLAGYFSKNREALLELARGQSPEVAIVACCDSRVDPAIIFDVAPGDVFVIRNVANLVPPFESEGRYHGTSAALEFAVTGLQVKHVVVLGHANCGGIKTLMSGKSSNWKSDFLDQWMFIAADAIEQVRQLGGNLSESERMHACEKAAAIHSRKNLMTFPWIRERVHKGTLSLHAWYYDLGNGSLDQLAS